MLYKMKTISRTVLTRKIDFKNYFKQAGYITYFKLTISIWKNTYTNSLFKQFNIFYKAWFTFVLFLKSFWWIIIKPAFQIFTKFTHIYGEFTSYDNCIPIKHSVKKEIIFKIFFIPFFKYSGNLNADDWEKLLK